jgi:branched-chain amino acid aminotransferase
MPPKTDVIWMDGRFVPWDEAQVHVLAHALHYGTALFEGLRCYPTPDGPAIFRLEDHLERFYRSAAHLYMNVPVPLDQLADICREIVARNRLEDGYVRPVAFYGLGGMNFSFRDNAVHVAVAVWPWGAYLGEEGMRRGIRVKTVSWIKTPSSSVPSGVKLAGNYVNACLAFQEAMRAGFDEAILLNEGGRVAEGTGENVFVVRGRALVTPPASEDLLPGITRDSVLRIAADLGYEVRVAPVSQSDLRTADELFLTGTAAEVTPVRDVDGHAVGGGSAGPVTRAIQKAFFAAVRGEDPRYRAWLTPVEDGVSAGVGNVRQLTESVSANVK